MNGKWAACCWMAGIGLILAGCSTLPADGGGEPSLQAASGIEESVQNAVNEARRKAGKPTLPANATLADFARRDSVGAAAAGQLHSDNTAALLSASGLGGVGKLQGSLKDRGPQTARAFVDYWAATQRRMLMDDGWTGVGIGVSQ